MSKEIPTKPSVETNLTAPERKKLRIRSNVRAGGWYDDFTYWLSRVENWR